MKVLLLRVSKGRNAWADAAVAEYTGRLGSRLPFTERVLRPEPFRGDVAKVRAAETARVLACCRPRDRVIALDERGRTPDSEGFAGWLDEAARASTSRLVFTIGGPYGHDDEMRRRAWRVLALSSMVLNHQVARLVLAEQLYRASTLLWGGRYHHA